MSPQGPIFFPSLWTGGILQNCNLIGSVSGRLLTITPANPDVIVAWWALPWFLLSRNISIIDSYKSYQSESEFYYSDDMTNGNEKENIGVICNEENQRNVDFFTMANVWNYILAQREENNLQNWIRLEPQEEVIIIWRRKKSGLISVWFYFFWESTRSVTETIDLYQALPSFSRKKYIYVNHGPGGSYWKKLCPRAHSFAKTLFKWTALWDILIKSRQKMKFVFVFSAQWLILR